MLKLWLQSMRRVDMYRLRNLISSFFSRKNKKVIRFKRSRNPELFDELQKRMKENPYFLNNLINYELDKKHKGEN